MSDLAKVNHSDGATPCLPSDLAGALAFVIESLHVSAYVETAARASVRELSADQPIEHEPQVDEVPAAPNVDEVAAPPPWGPFDLNVIGIWTLYLKEVRRFLKVPLQTVLAPLVTVMMFLLVFSVALGRGGRTIGEVPFLEFLAPGLIMMAIIQNAFANTSSSIMIGKIQGNIVDVLMPPFRSGELLFGIVAGGVTRGVLVAVVVFIAMLFVIDLANVNWGLALFYALSGSLMLSLLGFLGGLWAEKFDQMSAVTNFIITPLSFLSGTFYSITQLPENVRDIAFLNPFFYLIDGLRHALVGTSDGSILVGMLVVTVINAALWLLAYRLLKQGYRIKA
ncbi:MAG: ABC transporter permease [Pseudomonadota bacterium]